MELIIEIITHAHMYTTPRRDAPSYSVDRRLETVDIPSPSPRTLDVVILRRIKL